MTNKFQGALDTILAVGSPRSFTTAEMTLLYMQLVGQHWPLVGKTHHQFQREKFPAVTVLQNR